MGIFGKSKKEEVSHVLGLVLRQHDGVAYLYASNPDSQKVEVVDQRNFKFTHGWDQLVYDVDDVLYNFEQDRNIKLSNIFYFLFSHLMDPSTKEIKETYNEYLKIITKDNRLDPLGYFEFNELVLAYYEARDGEKLNAVVIEADDPSTTIFVYKNGICIARDSIAKTSQIAKDVEEMLGNVPKNVMIPSRIIIYDSKHLEDEVNQLLTHIWKEGVFLHLPRIELVSESDMTKALLHGVQKHMFPQANDSLAAMAMDGASRSTQQGEHESVEDDAIAEVFEKPDPVEIAPEASSIQMAEVLGFSVGRDVRLDNIKTDSVTVPSAYNPTFTPVSSNSRVEDAQIFTPESEVEQVDYDESIRPAQKKSSKSPFLLVKHWKNKLMSMKPNFPAFSSSSAKKKLLIPVSIGMFLLILAGGMLGTLYFFHVAELKVEYEPENIVKSIEVGKELTITEHNEDFTESAEIVTTGNKLVGEKAKGKVTIYNASDKDVNLDKGTEIKASDGKIFLLQESVKSKAGTTKITSEGDILTTTSKTEANVAAEEIGTEYNLKPGEFVIGSNSKSDIFAKSTAAFTGGTKDELQAVSSEDYKAINETINDKLDKKAKDSAKTTGNNMILSDLTSIKIENEKYSAEIGEEAHDLSLEVQASVTYYKYNDDELKNIIIREVSKNKESHFAFKKENISYVIEDIVKTDDDTFDLTVKSKAQSSYNVDKGTLSNSLRGKKTSEVRDILESTYKASGYSLNIHGPFKFLHSIVPYFSKNLDITYEAQS